MFEIVDNVAQSAVIKVFGVGGGGGNAVQHMIKNTIDGVEFICANTDAQALEKMDTKLNLQLGGGVTKGLGAGANPEIGRQAALEETAGNAHALSLDAMLLALNSKPFAGIEGLSLETWS